METTTTTNKAVADLKNLAKKFEGLVQVGKLLEELGSVEQATRNEETKRDKAILANQEASSSMDKSIELLGESERELILAQKRLEFLKDDAKKESKLILMLAHQESEKIAKACDEKKESILKEINVAFAELSLVKTNIEEQNKE